MTTRDNDKGFNEIHLELKLGEMFIGNYDDLKDFHNIDRKTKRMGRVAYDRIGNIVHDWFPVFVQKDECLNGD